MIIGRFAPSPTGELHLGNLRTALAAYLSSKRNGRDGIFLIRFEDLDRVTSSRKIAHQQKSDLAAVGVTSDRWSVFQSERFELYHHAIARLSGQGLTYPCFCTRKEIREAATAPHDGLAIYPGTCRNLTAREQEERGRERPGALRLNAHAAGFGGVSIEFGDVILGKISGSVDDVVLRRNDGVPSYNIAVVVDDEVQGVTEVVRGDDLAEITPTQIALQRLLGYETPQYLHVPLMYGDDGERLSKRHGAVTLSALAAQGVDAETVRTQLLQSMESWFPYDRS